MSNNITMFSIKELFSKGDMYIIPIYQRNFSWEQSHLQQLVQDVWDSCRHAPNRNYYLGTLVVHKNAQKLYETIDGQQRLTTINIILCAMLNEIEEDNTFSWFKGVNLTYQLRQRASSSLKQLYEHINPSDIEDKHIYQMYNCVQSVMETVFECSMSKDNATFLERYNLFKQYFFQKVIITRTPLPSDIDLNHYFEIMNTRGEQLEKHEILKARILYQLKDNPKASWLANHIWEACADMSKYVQMGIISPKLRHLIFSYDMNTLNTADFDTLVNLTQDYWDAGDSSPRSIIDIITGNTDQTSTKSGDETENRDNDEPRFYSVINFSNFLLHVLRITSKKDIPLDDKRLLEIFDSEKIDTAFARQFIYNLLKTRFLFDKFIIKRDFSDGKEYAKWNIQKIEVYDKGYSYINTFSDTQKKNIMIQSMFHVSLPSQNYKHWLCAALLYLSEHSDGYGLYDYLNRLSHAYMLDRFMQPSNEQLDYYKIIFENKGIPIHNCPEPLNLPRFDTGIDVFYFNYLDMQLWLEDYAPEFVFTSRSSIEHFYPQHPMENFEHMDNEHLHSFGNLCLISSSKNSRLSNFSPIQKTDFYNKSTTIDSIKQKLMMDICKEKGNWECSDIEKHTGKMKEELIKSLKS